MKCSQPYFLGFFIVFFISLGSCKGPEIRQPINQTSGSFINQSVERNKALYQKEAQQLKKLQDSLEREGLVFRNSSNGFWYATLTQDTTQTKLPRFGDHVLFSYELKDLRNQILVAQDTLNLLAYKVDQTNQELISGIREGIKLMHKGETSLFLLPSYKAYGYYGLTEVIPSNTPLQCTVTIHQINPKTNE